jgi:hypothetical protein
MHATYGEVGRDCLLQRLARVSAPRLRASQSRCSRVTPSVQYSHMCPIIPRGNPWPTSGLPTGSRIQGERVDQ